MNRKKRIITSIDIEYPKEKSFSYLKQVKPKVIGHTKEILKNFRWCGIHLILNSYNQKIGEIWVGSYLRKKDGKVANKLCFFSSPNQVYMKNISYNHIYEGLRNPIFNEKSLINHILIFIKDLSDKNLSDLQIDIDINLMKHLLYGKNDPFFPKNSSIMESFRRSSSELLICKESLEKRYSIEEAPRNAVFVDFRKLNTVQFLNRNGIKIGELKINFDENFLYTQLRFDEDNRNHILHLSSKIPQFSKVDNNEEFAAYLTATMNIIHQMQISKIIQLYFTFGDERIMESNLKSSITFQKIKYYK